MELLKINCYFINSIFQCFAIMAVGQEETAGRKLENMCWEEFQITLKTINCCNTQCIVYFFFSSAECPRVRLVYSSLSLNTVSHIKILN